MSGRNSTVYQEAIDNYPPHTTTPITPPTNPPAVRTTRSKAKILGNPMVESLPKEIQLLQE